MIVILIKACSFLFVFAELNKITAKFFIDFQNLYNFQAEQSDIVIRQQDANGNLINVVANCSLNHYSHSNRCLINQAFLNVALDVY